MRDLRQRRLIPLFGLLAVLSLLFAACAAPAAAPAQPSDALTVGHAPTDATVLPPALQAAWLQLARQIIAKTEDVGAQFAQEARRIHHGEVQERAIRGQATPDEAMELVEEGIAVVPLPLPLAAKETLQ